MVGSYQAAGDSGVTVMERVRTSAAGGALLPSG
jgi:hypothetical protein